jgi:predicted DNA-binding transcriptional regulator AlpA
MRVASSFVLGLLRQKPFDVIPGDRQAVDEFSTSAPIRVCATSTGLTIAPICWDVLRRRTQPAGGFFLDSATMEGSLDAVDPLDAAILARLSAITGLWGEYESDSLTETERHADEYLMGVRHFRVEITGRLDNRDSGDGVQLTAYGTGDLTRDGITSFVLSHCPRAWISPNGEFQYRIDARWRFARISRTTEGDRAAAIVASGGTAIVLACVRQGPILEPQLQLIERKSISPASATSVSAAQAIAKTGDVVQSVSVNQPITVNVNNQVDLSSAFELAFELFGAPKGGNDPFSSCQEHQTMLTQSDSFPSSISPEPASSLINATQLALMLGVSETYAKEMDRSGRIPGGVNIGSYRRWSRQVVSDWIRRGCPKQ